MIDPKAAAKNVMTAFLKMLPTVLSVIIGLFIYEAATTFYWLNRCRNSNFGNSTLVELCYEAKSVSLARSLGSMNAGASSGESEILREIDNLDGSITRIKNDISDMNTSVSDIKLEVGFLDNRF